MIFCSLGTFVSAGYIFPIVWAKAANAWAIKLFCLPSEGLFLLSPSFIFGGWGRGWLGGWLGWWFEGRLFPWSLSSSLSSLSEDFSSKLLLLVYIWFNTLNLTVLVHLIYLVIVWWEFVQK